MSKSTLTTDFSKRRYECILVDPPWHWRPWSNKGAGRSASNHYDTMTPEEMRAMRLPAADSCALFMWVVDSMLPDALRLINAWDFKFKTVVFTWVKTNGKQNSLFYDEPGTSTGMGYWTRKNCEMVLLATRGKPHRTSKSVKQTIFSNRREHSRKPLEIYELIEALVPGPRLEMFARHIRPGWDSFGDQLGKF